MISLRQHAISLIAIFLALTLGLFLGSGFIGDRMNALTGTDRDRISNLQDERDALEKEVGNDTAFINGVSSRLTKGVLAKRSVLVVTSPDASDAEVQSIKGLINDAGGTVSGQMAMTTNLVRDEDASKLRTIIDQSIPTGAQLRVDYTDSASRLGDLLGVVLLSREGARPAAEADRATALQTLRQGGFLDYTEGAIKPADLVLVVTGGEMPKDSGAQGQFVGRFAAAMASRGSGGVLAGRDGSAAGGSPIGVVRSDPSLNNAVSTVDNIEQQTGQITSVLALGEESDGRTGAYGTGPGATVITVGAEPAK
ncbi:copper transporter [Gordonia sp. (in: high G+C Gram-positive bacteria)]|uniref:copper transporter n=1 Tax=Gordonia sp. (in: high G+C Gram-positive bacteria) TaxID=84139 RepID=UPI00168FF8A1|nr:copper transporter [Gordonia sp. (in: high G+C Gram-positive bacteria)]NLG48090.1 copper transporter [Gordonia sp. (in: high G+C Gram-positive bacteria)]